MSAISLFFLFLAQTLRRVTEGVKAQVFPLTLTICSIQELRQRAGVNKAVTLNENSTLISHRFVSKCFFVMKSVREGDGLKSTFGIERAKETLTG